MPEMKKEGPGNITFNSVHPCSAMTNLWWESTKSLLVKVIYFLWRPLMTSAVVGAISSLNAAPSPEMEGITGKYFGRKGEEKPSTKYYSPENE